MWPWEHLALGYVLLSLYTRLRSERPPSGREAVVVAVATQLPDLVDKPLAWIFDILPSGVSLAHSALTALLLVYGIHRLSQRLDTPDVGPAFAVGYLSHLLGDSLYPLLTDGELAVGYLLWPFVPAAQHGAVGFLGRFQSLWLEFIDFLGTPAGRFYLVFEVIFIVGACLLWLYDGRPGLADRWIPPPMSTDD